MAVATMAPPERGRGRLTASEVSQIKRDFIRASEELTDKFIRRQEKYVGISDKLKEIPGQHFDIIFNQFQRLSRWMAMLTQAGVLAPGVATEGGKSIPVDVLGSDAKIDQTTVRESVSRIEYLSKLHGLNATSMSIPEAREVAADGMTDSVASGINIARSIGSQGGENLSNYMSSNLPGLSVTVHTKQSGLILLYSPAYFIQYNLRFGGGLSTPVASYVNPGRYLFGAIVDKRPVFEQQEHRIPPNLDIHMGTV